MALNATTELKELRDPRPIVRRAPASTTTTSSSTAAAAAAAASAAVFVDVDAPVPSVGGDLIITAYVSWANVTTKLRVPSKYDVVGLRVLVLSVRVRRQCAVADAAHATHQNACQSQHAAAAR
jgi:hypothetical protein